MYKCTEQILLESFTTVVISSRCYHGYLVGATMTRIPSAVPEPLVDLFDPHWLIGESHECFLMQKVGRTRPILLSLISIPLSKHCSLTKGPSDSVNPWVSQTVDPIVIRHWSPIEEPTNQAFVGDLAAAKECRWATLTNHSREQMLCKATQSAHKALSVSRSLGLRLRWLNLSHATRKFGDQSFHLKGLMRLRKYKSQRLLCEGGPWPRHGSFACK